MLIGWTVMADLTCKGFNGYHLKNLLIEKPNSAPAHCAAIKAGTPSGAIPAKLSVHSRPNAAAGFANEVDAVNQYAAFLSPFYSAYFDFSYCLRIVQHPKAPNNRA